MRAVARARRIDLRPTATAASALLMAGLLAAACLAAAGAAHGQPATTQGPASPADRATPPEKVAPVQPVPTTPVIRPPSHVDPGMAIRPPPTRQYPTPVIKPNTTTGGIKPG